MKTKSFVIENLSEKKADELMDMGENEFEDWLKRNNYPQIRNIRQLIGKFSRFNVIVKEIPNLTITESRRECSNWHNFSKLEKFNLVFFILNIVFLFLNVVLYLTIK